MMRHLLSVAFLVALGCGVWYVANRSATAYTEPGLAAYAAAERLDPIFAIQGTDPAALTHSLDEFFTLHDKLARRYAGSERSTIESLYPADFLRLLPRLESARQAVLANSTIDNARAYHALLVQTIDAYVDDAHRVAGLVRGTNDTYPTFNYVAGVVRPSDLAAKIDAAAASARTQLQKENERYACLNNPALCTSLSSLLAQRLERIGTSTPVAAPSAQVRAVAALTESLNSSYRSYLRTDPTVFVIPSTCVPSSTVAYVQAYYLSNQHGLGRKLSFVHDAYFYDLVGLHSAFPQVAEYDLLVSIGIPWQYQNYGNLYECPDSGYDQAAVSSLVGMREALHTHATSTEAERILSLTTLSKADLAPYVARMAKADTPAANDLAERCLEGSSDFDQTILGALNDNAFMLASTTAQQKLPPAMFVVLVRNYASTFFLMGNPTFIPDPQSLFASHASQVLADFHLRSYVSGLSGLVGANTLVAQFKKSLDIEYPTTP